MGQKVNPHGLRVGIIKNWDAQWYAGKKDFANNLIEDNKIRTYLKKKYYKFAISRITISRVISSDILTVNVYTSKPGAVIGKGGAGVDEMKKEVMKLAPKKNVNIDAQLVAENIALQLENRVQFRRAMKQSITRAMKSGIQGIKTMVSGRLDGREIAGSENYHEGSIPLQTLRADIDYATAEAHTTFGVIGVKVWIYKGEVLGKSTTKEGGNA